MKGRCMLKIVGNGVTNVYRTDKHIVYQTVFVGYGDSGNILISDDVFYTRTPERDSAYEKAFGAETLSKKRRRMKVAAYTRKYIE